MTSQTTQAALMLATATLQHSTPERLQRAVDGFCSGAFTVTLTHTTDHEISGFVSNGDGQQYGVTLTSNRSFCSCKDAMFRQATCKHAVALALHVIRTPQAKEEPARQLEGRIGRVRYLEEQVFDLTLSRLSKNFDCSV